MSLTLAYCDGCPRENTTLAVEIELEREFGTASVKICPDCLGFLTELSGGDPSARGRLLEHWWKKAAARRVERLATPDQAASAAV